MPEYIKPHSVNPDLKKVIIIGSGGLAIGQAGEFDYSGSQAIKALKEEGIEVVLVNPNIATNQTSETLADKIYYLPVTLEYVSYIIQKERPQGVLLTFGGQTALNCGIALEKTGVLAKFGVKVLGTPIATLETSEDREMFADALKEINIPIAESVACETVEEAVVAVNQIGFPVIVRSAFALGGLGSGFAYNMEQLNALVTRALSLSPQVLVERSMRGWKEVEYEVVRDSSGNCITVCNMENFDPLGVHTGDSIVVAPSQTLSDEEFHMLRSAAIKIINHLGVVGECNVQYALSPDSLDYCVIEVNARLSRSSALASKATGYPLAYTAAKIALGYTLPQLPNPITKTTVANFEPSLDYTVIKVPKWDLRKFQHVNTDIGSAMKSVGEVMSIGRSFEEAFQKALREVDPSLLGFQGSPEFEDKKVLDDVLANPTDKRWMAVGQALIHENYTVDQVHDLSKIDKWFLHKCKNIAAMQAHLSTYTKVTDLEPELLLKAKKIGFSDKQIGIFTKTPELEVRKYRLANGFHPWVKRIDTLAAEVPASTNYLYMTYNASSHDVKFDENPYVVLGSGVYRIGSSVEFDWCAVNTVKSLRNRGEKVTMINYNPETVSTDFDEVDRLYFEELSLERCLDIIELENPRGTIISMGGQLPQNIALPLYNQGVKIMGTSPKDIDNAENRHVFSTILDSINVDQPLWKELSTLQEASDFAEGEYPVLIRPSYVLSGAAMAVVDNSEELHEKLEIAADVSPEHPVVMSKFHLNSRELDIDSVACNGELIAYAVSEHLEDAGVHSGDASLVLPPQNTTTEEIKLLKTIAEKVAKAWSITGPFNMQILILPNEDIKVIECNIRASRSLPFVSKVLGCNFVDLAVSAFFNDTKKIAEFKEKYGDDLMLGKKYDYVAVKSPQFSFNRLAGADPFLSVEMASTGEVCSLGKDLKEAYWGSIQSTMNFKVPINVENDKKLGILFGGNLPQLENVFNIFDSMGKYNLFATDEATCQKLGGSVQLLKFPEDTSDKKVLRSLYEDNSISCVINLAHAKAKDTEDLNYLMRRNAIDFGLCLFNEPNTSLLFAECLKERYDAKLKLLSSGIDFKTIPEEVKAWDEFVDLK
ncbi:carbamoyl-phosphate synthase (glutamine-hydrolyzing) cpa2 [Hanseniaspora valbyensis]